MNTYSKFTANVFLMKTEDNHKKGDVVIVETKYGKENESIVFNHIYSRDGYNYYSIVRADGFNVQERAKAKAEKYGVWADSAQQKSNEKYEESQEGRDFLSLGEPIKVGHHSEKRHRALIERNWNRMDKSVELKDKAEEHKRRAEYWAKQADTINLSMPESVDYYEHMLSKAIEEHKFLKENPDKRAHSYSLTYANNKKKETQKKFDLAKRLWG